MTTTHHVETIDIGFMGRPTVIAAGLIDEGGTLALVDPGPASSLPRLEAALGQRGASLADVRAVLITHIHLDHSGAAGVIARRFPHVRVFVHERGAPHVVDPSRLVQSATRLYGDQMDRLWGEIAPVAADRIQVLHGGERLSVGGLALDVGYTPGHAWHHVSYYHPASGTAFVGDTGGIRLPGGLEVIPPTPPPDIDLEAWTKSLDLVRAWHPARLFLTHFGIFDDPGRHLESLERTLRRNAELVERLLGQEGTDEWRAARFAETVQAEMARALPPEVADRYELAVPLDHCWAGLARYWRKRAGGETARERPAPVRQ